MPSRPLQYMGLLFRMCLAAVFLYAGLGKLTAPAEFAIAIENYRLIPPVLTNTAAIFLPWIEIWCGAALLTGIWQRGGAALIAGMSAMFIAALLSVILRGLEIDCGCFGTGTRVDFYRIAEDVALFLMACYLLKFPSDIFTLPQLRPKLRQKPAA